MDISKMSILIDQKAVELMQTAHIDSRKSSYEVLISRIRGAIRRGSVKDEKDKLAIFNADLGLTFVCDFNKDSSLLKIISISN